ncbi:MAG: hypothetical protein LBQ40_00265 [Clostridiales bacterium]|jgi:hypothetical protein|nr:hypothetical protein [Clostridiales bacterium]
MKKYFSSTKEYSKYKKRHIPFKALLFLARPFCKPRELIFEAPLPKEPLIFMANHATDYGPTSILFGLDRKFRIWSSANMLFLKTAPSQIMKTIFPNVRGPLWGVARVFSYPMAVAMRSVFVAAETIPVYRDMRVKMTYQKTLETLKEGLDVVIFPDSLIPDPENPYMDVMQRGAFKTLTICRNALGTPPKVVPVYCCKPLKTLVFGSPLQYDASLPPKDAEEKLLKQVGQAIKRLAESLPPHEIVHYSEMPKDVSRIKKYIAVGEEKLYEEVAALAAAPSDN